MARRQRQLLSKQRVGAKALKRYDRPQTPDERVVATGVLSPGHHARAAQVAVLDPVALAGDIQRTLGTLWKLAAGRQPCVRGWFVGVRNSEASAQALGNIHF